MALVAVGMTGAAAPLTTAVLSAVDPRHTGAASGLNSAVSRAGGLVVTALLGFVLASRGRAMMGNLHRAAIMGAVLSFTAAACAFVGLAGESRQSPGPRKPDSLQHRLGAVDGHITVNAEEGPRDGTSFSWTGAAAALIPRLKPRPRP